MKTVLAALVCLAASPACAEWRVDEGVAIQEPSATNGNVELIALSCGDPTMVEVYARGGAVMPADRDVQADYFYLPGKVRAQVDGQSFAMTAAGSDGAVVLFSEGSKAQNYMAPVAAGFIAALKKGKTLTLAFDITPDKGADGSALETMATFPLDGAGLVIDEALGACAR